MSDEKREWLVRKGGYFYRPNGAGYTTRKIEAGRYTKAEAVLEAAVEPLHMTVLHESEIPDEPAISAPPASGWRSAMTELDKDALDAAARAIAGGGSLRDAIRAYLDAADDWRPVGHVTIEHDGFSGDIIGHYTTREGKRGVVVQQDGTRVVHVYGERWLLPSPPKEGE